MIKGNKDILIINTWLKRLGTKYIIGIEKTKDYGTIYRLNYINPSGRISDVYIDTNLENCVIYAICILKVPVDIKFKKEYGFKLHGIEGRENIIFTSLNSM